MAQQHQQRRQQGQPVTFLVFGVSAVILSIVFGVIGVLYTKSNVIDPNHAFGLEYWKVESLLQQQRRGPKSGVLSLKENNNGDFPVVDIDKQKRETFANDNTDTSDPADNDDVKRRLNVIVLYPDDMRHDSLSCAGTQRVQTPFLDYLAQTGIRFSYNCVTTSVCWISRATLFTGQWHARHQATYLFRPIKAHNWNHTYPYILRQHGYYVGHVGKWQYRNEREAQKYFDYAKIYEGFHMSRGRHVTDRNQQDAIDFLNKRPRNKNFALLVAFYAPKAVGSGEMQWTPKNSTQHLYLNETFSHPKFHNESFLRLPYLHRLGAEARKRWKQRFGTAERYHNSMRAYYRMITEVDEACRNIYKTVEEQGILNETMIIFTTDNGFFHGEHGLAGKWFPYQESIRVPLIIHDPRLPRESIGTVRDEYTLNVDLAETILGAASIPPDSRMQGRDIADLYLVPRNKTTTTTLPWRSEFFYEFPGLGKFKIPQANALIRKDYKLFVYPEWNVTQLFNLQNDPFEEKDLFPDPKYSDIVQEMRKRYEELQEAVK